MNENTKQEPRPFDEKVRQFFIVNQVDRPCERLIAERRGDKLFYVHPELAGKKEYHGMSMNDAVDVQDFGFELVVEGNELRGTQVYDSRAIYPDGKGRRWQGSQQFSIPLPNTKPRGDHER